MHQITNFVYFKKIKKKKIDHEKEPPEWWSVNERCFMRIKTRESERWKDRKTNIYYQGPYSNLIHSEIEIKIWANKILWKKTHQRKKKLYSSYCRRSVKKRECVQNQSILLSSWEFSWSHRSLFKVFFFLKMWYREWLFLDCVIFSFSALCTFECAFFLLLFDVDDFFSLSLLLVHIRTHEFFLYFNKKWVL